MKVEHKRTFRYDHICGPAKPSKLDYHDKLYFGSNFTFQVAFPILIALFLPDCIRWHLLNALSIH